VPGSNKNRARSRASRSPSRCSLAPMVELRGYTRCEICALRRPVPARDDSHADEARMQVSGLIPSSFAQISSP
jgi:hypothetical protein